MSDLPKPTMPVDHEDSPPPFLGSWRNVYLAVAAYLATLIALFALFRRVFEP